MKKLAVTYRPTESLKPYARNARTHSEAQVAQIAASITEFGFTQPILVDGKSGVVAGHGRLLAAKSLGMAQVPVIELSGLSAAQKRAYVIADNKLTLNGGWDEGVLAEELEALGKAGFDLKLTGFDEVELVSFLSGTEGQTDPDDVPDAPADPVTRLGDVWVCGQHRVLCGDSTDADSVATVTAGARASLLWTDPPYGVSYVGKTKDSLRIENDGAAGIPSLLAKAWASVATGIEPGAPFYIARPPGELAVAFGVSVIEAGWKLHEELQWIKDTMVLGHSDYHLKHETIMYGWLPGKGRSGRGKHVGSRWFGSNSETSVFEIPRPKASKDHPTGKPVDLVQRQMVNSSEPSGTVLDPFLGSGTTMIAAEMTGRRCYGIELSPAYVDVIVNRWQAFTGRSATLAGTDTTFDEIARQRAREAA